MPEVQEIISQIIECNGCDLRKNIIKHYGEKINSPYDTFHFYYSQSDIKIARFIAIMQNPNPPKEGEIKKPSIIDGDEKFIAANRQFLISWLKTKNGSFLEKFVKILRKYKLLEYVIGDPNFDGSFLKDFLFTDIVKCKSYTKSVSPENVGTCHGKYLKKELEQFGKDKLIFVFSSRAWESIYDHYIYMPTQENIDKKLNKVTHVHGQLFKSEILNSYFIPLVHFSQLNNLLRNSYFEYLEEGLKEYSELIKHTN